MAPLADPATDFATMEEIAAGDPSNMVNARLAAR